MNTVSVISEVWDCVLNEDCEHWLLLDAIRIKHLLRYVYEDQGSPHWYSLFQDTPLQAWKDKSPLLIRVEQHDPLFNRFKETPLWRSSGIVLSTHYNEHFLAHLRSLTLVHNSAGLPMMFRFYSPTVLESLIPALKQEDIAEIMGAVSALAWWSESSQNWKTIKQRSTSIYNANKAAPWLVLNDKHWQEMTRLSEKEVVHD